MSIAGNVIDSEMFLEQRYRIDRSTLIHQDNVLTVTVGLGTRKMDCA
jgi:hypothetical protein